MNSQPDDIAGLLPAVRDACALPAGARVVVAMSGGVDSTVTAALLKATGFEVIGITMRLYEPPADDGLLNRACCGGRETLDAQAAAARLGIEHHVLDLKEEFAREVISPFVRSYLEAKTPIPCVDCNRTVKFSTLLRVAKELGAVALMTGHYAEIRPLPDEGGHFGLFTPADLRRDQSYFLYATTQKQLDFLRFPLARLHKPAVRAVARALGLKRIAAKPDSQDICFVPGGDYRALLEQFAPQARAPGEIVHVNGQVLGWHDGIFRFTIGQRRKLGVTTGEPLYVVAIERESNRVVVGPRAALARRRIVLENVNWLGPRPLPESKQQAIELHVKIRSTRPPVPARVWAAPAAGAGARVELLTPEYGIAPGQACVFYERAGAGARVFGGGVIVASPR